MSLSVQNVSKIYQEQRALDDVSFEIKAGEIVGFLGPNGAGKSTMMKILTCYIPPTLGTAQVCGFDVMENPLEVRKRVGYLPEHNPLYLEMYVREFLHFMAGIHKVDKKRVDEMIDLTGLKPESHKKIHQLSKGYRQRVGLAHALIHRPEVMIFDEPTTGLDPNQIVEIRSLIKSIGKDRTVMLSTHIMQEVELLCDRVIIINKGKIVADQPVEELKNVSGRKVLLVEFDREVNQNHLRKIPGIIQATQQGKQWRLESKPSSDVRKEVFQFAVNQGITILESKIEANKLEDVFRNLTQKK
jgi:ABC-2 type transport system ATP-binding protein